jgi:hypothetical protein
MVATGALFPDPDTAHDWLRRELSRAEYRESLSERFSRWFNNLIDDLAAATQGHGLSPVAALVLLALLAGGIALVLSRLRANPAPAGASAAVFSEARQTADEHRRRADAALQREEWGEAVVEAVRALAAGLVERGLMPEQSGVTVHEISERAGELFPREVQGLEAMSLVFDETRYGDRPPDEGRAREVVELERELGTRTPESGARGTTIAVPR